ncbi:pseudouridine synthase [Sporosalibacterium faouarense]|uniref:pseudouridine synthase n=1 Tax=Sporosalibacterium faouarense TaxID=516123 RepID=UPI00192B53F8|nr:pseudouridine synthase [Sporosalibacterium faouarense]
MAKKERLDKVLSNMGYGSRKDVKGYIKQGLVTVDGEVVKSNSVKVDPYEAEIIIDGNTVEYREYIYLMMNKPDGVVSSTDDPRDTTVIDLIEEGYRIFEPFPIGRLDKDTEGLLIISNDGKLAHNLLSPKKHVEKTYYVEVDGRVGENDINTMSEGVIIDGDYKTMPAKLEILESNNISKVYLTIKEGKFHQVKRMFEAVDKSVIYLKRIAMGNLELDEDLNLGEYRELEEFEIELLKGMDV